MAHRSPRDRRRRSLGQNFLCDKHLARELAALAAPDELVVEFGAGRGALTIPLARSGARVIAIERDPVWAKELKRRLLSAGLSRRVQVLETDMLNAELPSSPYRVIASPPFNLTTALLRALLDEPALGPVRADLIIQKEVARKRTAATPTTLLSTTWAPWWHFEIVRIIPRTAFRPIPKVDAAWVAITARKPPVLPVSMAPAFGKFVRSNWRAPS